MRILLAMVITTLLGFLPLDAISDTIAIIGLEKDIEGSAAWNADGTGPEPANTGHEIWWAPDYCLEVAYYYAATRDYVDDNAISGLHALEITDGFPQFGAELLAQGYSIDQLTVKFGLMSLGEDLEGQDWSYDEETHVETRRYRGGTYVIQMDGEDMVGGEMPDFTIWVDYNLLEDCLDDEIIGETDYTDPADASGESSPGVQEVAAAFLADVGYDGIRILFGSLQPAGQTEFEGNGRTGAYFEAHSGQIETGVSSGMSLLGTELDLPFSLGHVHPNPCTSTASIEYSLTRRSSIELAIVSSSGRLVERLCSGIRDDGRYRLTWSGARYSSGVYFVRLKVGQEVTWTKLLLLH